ncbi:putative ribonuclease H-like domain-containing protein [Tanacetum coccineum]
MPTGCTIFVGSIMLTLGIHKKPNGRAYQPRGHNARLEKEKQTGSVGKDRGSRHEFSEFRVSESEGLHKGYDRFQKILSQLNQMQAKPDNEDCNMKFLRALPPSWSQVAITLKTKGGLDYLSFNDLYNKLRTLEIDVKGGSSYDSRGTSAPTHSAFISAASTNSKMSYPDQSHSTTFTSASSSPAASSNVIENVLHSFVAESDPQQQITYEDFDQIGKLDLEELDIKWQMAMLSVRINRFEKKAGRKMKFNNKDAARFDKKKVKCYKCSELGHFARECTGKQLDSKARYSSFKLKELDKSEEPKALLSVDSMLNWSDHEGEDVENGAAQVYGMIAGAEEDAAGSATGDTTGDVADDVSNAAAEFALMGISSQVHTCPFGCEHLYAELKKEFDNLEVQYKECYIQVQAYKSTLQTLEQQKGWYQSNQLALEERIRILTANLENTTNMLKYTEKLNEQAKLEKLNDKVKLEESKARFDKWKESSKNLDKLINSSMTSRSKFGLGFGDTFGSDEVFDLSAPSIFDSCLKDALEKPLYDGFVKASGLHAVPGPITGTFMPPSNKPDLDDTQVTYGSKSNNYSETNSVSNDFVSCDNSDKSSDSETTDFASCVSSVKSSSSKTNEPLASAPSSVDFKTVSETADQQSNSTNDDSSFSFKENVKPPRNLCNKSGINSRSLCKRKSFGSKTCFVCGSKFHLIKDCDFYEKQLELHNKPMWTNVANIPSFVPKAASVPAGSRNRPTSVPAGRTFSAGWKNHAARTMTRPTSHYFQHFHRPGYYNQMYMDEGRWGTAENPHKNRDLGIVDSGCSRSMTGNKEKLDDFVKIVGVVLRVSRRNNLYCFNLSDIQPERDVTCLLAKASLDESTKWHRRMAHVNFKNMNKLAKHGLVNGLPSKLFTNEHNCVACNKERNTRLLTRPSLLLVLVTRSHNKTPYELVSGKVPNISHLKPFGCLVTILNTSDHLGKFEGKADEGFIVGYAAHSKAYRVYNLSSKKIEETLNLRYLEDKPNVQGLGQEWYFDLDYLTDSLGYTRFKSNQPAGTQDPNIHAGTQDDSDSECDEQVIVVPSFPSNSFSGPKVHEASEMVESSSDYAEELARLQKQAYEANATAEKHLSQADLAASRNRVPAGKIDSAAGVSYGPTETSTPVFKPVHTDATSLPPGHSLGSSEHSTRYLSFYEVEKNSLLIRKYGKLCPLPDGKIAIGTKWILKNKRDARGIVVRNKARLVAQGHRQEEGIDYDEHVYRVMKALYGLHQAPRAWYARLSTFLLKHNYRRGTIDKTLFIKKNSRDIILVQSYEDGHYFLVYKKAYDRADGIFISQDKSMIGSLMYLTASRPDIQFAVSACSRHQVTPLTSNLNAVKKIFKYLKGQPKLGLWYPRDSPFVLEAYSDSDYVGSHGDRKSTTGGCQFLGRRLISWQCKKQTIVATSSTEAEYVAAANCCGQVLKIHTDENVADLLTKAFDGPSVNLHGKCGLILMIKSEPDHSHDHESTPPRPTTTTSSALVNELFDRYDESNTYVLERFNTSAGNPVKKILLKLNLSDHRLCKMVVECQSVKVKEFQERCNIKAFQEWYEHVGPEVASPQGGKVTSWRRDYAWLMISRCSRSLCQIQVQGTSSIQEVNDHNNIFTRESQEYELKTRDKA